MAEALGLASSIVALVQLSASVYSATSKFYRQAKEAKSKISALATQTRNLSGVLQDLSLLASSPLFDDAGVTVPDIRDTYIESCHSTLSKIKRRLEKAECDFESGSNRKIITRSLKWPFASQETNDLIAELGQHRDVLQLALSADTMSHLLQCLANTNRIAKSVQGLHRRLDRKESIDVRAELTAKREKIRQFFLKINPQDHLQDCRRRRQTNTGRWLIERDQTFQDWINSAGSQIWLSGIPGAGKTILCGAVVDETLKEQTPSTAVAFFFCDYKYPETQSPINVLAALAVQFAMQADEAFEALESYYEELHPHNGMKRQPEVKGMVEVIQKMLNHYQRVYIAVDGLDECGSSVVDLLRSLKQLTRASHVNMALFSRDETDISEELSEIPRIDIAAHTEDLELYVLAQMESRKRLGSLAVRNPKLHEHICRTLIEGANGMFRWVACQLDHLDSLPSDGRRRKALTELPPTLFETYDRILDRIMQGDEHEQELCRKALHWIGLSYKNIHPLALCEAISIPDDQDIVDEELLVDPEWISRSCSSLIRLYATGEESDYPHFQLAHFSVKEYLRSIKPQSKRSFYRFSEGEAIQDLMRSSLRFVTFPIFDRTPTVALSEIQRIAQRNEQHPFYPVASGYMFCSGGDYWDENLGDELSLLLEDETMMRYAKKLFSPQKTAIFLSWVLQALWGWPGISLGEGDFTAIIGLLLDPQLTTLHVAAALALSSVCTHLIDNENVDLNMCCRIGTPLHSLLAGVSILDHCSSEDFEYNPRNHYRLYKNTQEAAFDQPRQCLEIFAQHRADTSLLWGSTSAFQMAINCSIETVENKLWIEPLIRPSTVVNEGCIQAFKIALPENSIHQSILDAIVTLGSNPEAPSGWARLASLIQTRRMEEADYQENDIRLDLSDEDFADGLRISLERDLTDTLKIFVQDSRFHPAHRIPFEDRLTPILHYAIRPGCRKSVEILLDAGCDPNVVDEAKVWTTLHECAFYDTEDAATASLLLKSGVLDSLKDKFGKTCWHIAAEEGNTPVLEALLDLGSDTRQSLATISSAGRTPLASAILNKNIESALLLLDHCGADPEAFQTDQSLLDVAAAIGSADLFLLLHEKLKQAGAMSAIQDAEPLNHINMKCSPRLLDYLLDSWPADSTNKAHALKDYLLGANSDIFKDPDMYPTRDEMAHIIRRLLPPIDYCDHVNGATPKQFWNTFCEEVVPCLNEVCDHQQSHCRTDLVIMSFETLIEVGVLGSYEQNAHLPSYTMYFRSLVDRNHLGCSWIASSVQRVLEASSLQLDLSNEAVAGELLSCAMQHPNIDLVCQLLDHGVDVHAAHGVLSPVEQACYSSDLPTFYLIIKHSDETRINRAGGQGKTLLHWAVSGTVPGYLAKIQQLLNFGANIDSEVEDSNGDTALTLASRSHRQDIVALLVSEGANSLHRARDGWTVVHAAAATGDLRYIHALILKEAPRSFWLATCEAVLTYYDDGRPHITQNATAIHLAARYGTSGFLRYISQNHVPFDVDAVTGQPCLSPLHVACIYENLDVVEFLVSSKASVNVRDAHGQLAIDYATRQGHLEIFKTLLKAGSEVPSRHLSASIQRLMSRESEYILHSEDSKGISQFNFERAIIRGDLNYCKELVGRGQSINAELLTTSYTPLVCAIVERRIEIVDWLVSLGVEVKVPHVEALHPSLRCIASLATHHIQSTQTLTAILTLALEQNANWSGSILGPLHVAILDNKVEMLDMILKHVRKNNHAYRRMIEAEMVILPADIVGWKDRSALSILTNTFNSKYGQTNVPPWGQLMPPGSPLHWAIRKSNVSAVRLLLQHDAEVNQADMLGMTPLSLAALSEYPAKLVRQLLKAGAGLAEPTQSRLQTISSAIRKGDLEVVKILAEADPETLKHVDQFAADMRLRDAGSPEVFQYLVSQGSSPVRSLCFSDSAIAFHILPRASMGQFMFNSGLASQLSEDSLLLTVLRLVNEGDLRRIGWVKKLSNALQIDIFAKIVNRMRQGFGSPLCLAASINAAGMVEALITMGAELDSEGCPYGSPLMAACAWGSLEAVRYLVRSGALLRYVNEDGVLRSAASLSCSHEKIKRWLLVGRHTEQHKLGHQLSQSNTYQGVWSGSKLFKFVLPAYMQRNFGESRWSHLQRLEKWKKELLGSTLAESRRDSGLDFGAEREAEARKNAAQVAQRQFLASLGEH